MMEPNRPLPVVVYSPDSVLRKPKRLLKSIVKDLWSSRELAWRFFLRNIRTRYRQSIFGPLWTFLPPLITALTFTFLKASGAVGIEDTDLPYPFYVLFGTILWQLFVDSLQLPLNAMKKSQNLIKSIRIPIEAFVMAFLGEMLFDRSIQVAILIALFLIFQIPMQLGIIFLPVVVLLLILLGMGMGLFLVPIGTLYTDISSALPLITRFWFFLTPVIYPPPERFPYSLFSQLNPVSPLINSARSLVVDGNLGNPLWFMITAILAVILFVFGWLLYRLSIPILVERA